MKSRIVTTLPRLALLAFCLLLSAGARADLASFLEAVVQAHGGGATPGAVHERGVTESPRRGKGPVERWWQAPDRFRIEIAYPGGAESRLLHGAEAWQQGRPATPALRSAAVLQAARMALPWRLREQAERIIDLGTLPLGDGKEARTLEWRLGEGLRVIVEIDAKTRLILRSRGVMTINGASMEFATGYEDYQMVAGRRVAMTERHFAMGQYIGHTQLESVEFPDSLPESTFEPAAPAGVRAGATRIAPSG